MFEIIAGFLMLGYGVWSGSLATSDSFEITARWILQTLVAITGGLYLLATSKVIGFSELRSYISNSDKEDGKMLDNAKKVQAGGMEDFIALSYLRDRLASNGRMDGIELIAKLNGIFFEMNAPNQLPQSTNKE